jgi:hypothetical protein
MRRSFLLALAAGLLASLAFAPSSHAGSVIETIATIAPNGTGATATDITLTYSGGTLGSFVSAAAGSIVTAPADYVLSGGGTVVTVNFSAASSGFIDFTYTVATGAPTVNQITLSGVSGASLHHPLGVNGGSAISGVPEPASMALLGIGMAGIFACRRLFTRNAV